MPMDPISFWIQASVFWAHVIRQQHEAYLQMLGAIATTVPHPTAAQLSAQAQELAAASEPSVVVMRAAAKKPAAPRPASAKKPEPVNA